MDLALKRPWVGVLVFFCIAMVPSVSEGSCIAVGKFQPDTMMRMFQATLIKGNILQEMVENAMKMGDNSKMSKDIKELCIRDLNILSTNITLKPNDEIDTMVTINITLDGKSFIGGNMAIDVIALLETSGTISDSPDEDEIFKVTEWKMEVKSCKTNLPSRLCIRDLNIPGTNITLKPNDEKSPIMTINITVAGKSFLGGNMAIDVVALFETSGTISDSPDEDEIFKVTEWKMEVKSCKTNLPSSMLPKIVNKFLDSTLGKVMPGVLGPTADMMMDKQMAAFKNMLGKKAIGTIGYIIYEVAEKPVVFITYININLKMQIEKKNGEMIPYECEPLPTDLPPGKEKMSVVYLPGSALNAYMMLVQTHLNTVLTKVKGSVPTSDQLKKILPKVNLPAGKKLKVKITLIENPKVTVSSSANYITTNIEASFLDVKRGNQLLSITMKHQCSASFAIKEEHLAISLKAGSCRTLEVSSPAGDVTGATKYTETVVDSWIPFATGVLNKNQIPLPSMKNATGTTDEPELSFGPNLLMLQKSIPPYTDTEMSQEVKKQRSKIKL